MTHLPSPLAEEDPIRPHTYDGIQEYDKRLPNWWLYTLYIAIVFWVGYWSYYEWFRVGPSSAQAISAEMAKIEAARLSTAKLDDVSLWKMSRNAEFVAAGKTLFEANCAACHLASLRGKSESPAAIGCPPKLSNSSFCAAIAAVIFNPSTERAEP